MDTAIRLRETQREVEEKENQLKAAAEEVERQRAAIAALEAQLIEARGGMSIWSFADEDLMKIEIH